MRRKILKAVIFNVLVVLCIFISYLVIPKTDARENRATGYKLKDNKNLDIVAIGNSDLYSGFVPSILYEKYKYCSYNCGKTRVTVKEEYDYLKEIFDYQDPQLIIFEVDCLSFKTYKRPKPKLESVYENHDFWRKHSAKDILELKGYVYSSNIVPTNLKEKEKKKKRCERAISEDKFDYLDCIRDLCKENNCQLLFMELPSETSWSEVRHNQVLEYANKNNINFIDFNYLDSVTIDNQKDYRDGGNHLNVYGSIKVTNYLADYIHDNYEINPYNLNKTFDKAVEIFNKKIKEL